jgi:glycosyltransferase involved in cell wall biosynthesis
VTVELVRDYGCRYVVHLEDNDEVVLAGELGAEVDLDTLRSLPLPVLDRIVRPRQSHPLRARRLLEQSAGITVLIDRLLELVPGGVPAAVVRAGFDEAVLEPFRARDEVRAELGLAATDLAIVYTGNVHSLNRAEMRSLYESIHLLRERGVPAVLVKTGWGSAVSATFPSLGPGIRDLGWVPRETIPDLLAAADVLVQPGGPGPFNDYRFPSKLPEFLASGRPVVLPRANVGLELQSGEEALVLERGDAAEIAEKVEQLAGDPDLRARVGEAGRAFALRELRWTQSVDSLARLLDEIAADPRLPAPAWALDGADPPALVLALVPELPNNEQAQAARAAGVFGFCVDAAALDGLELPLPFPLCVWLRDPTEESSVSEEVLAAGAYVAEGGARVVVCREPASGSLRSIRTLPLVLEEMPVAEGYTMMMQEVIQRPSPSPDRVRVVVVPQEIELLRAYATWLRKVVLEAAILAPERPPLVLIDATQTWGTAAWLEATRAGVRDGIRQFYASQNLAVSDDEADLIIRSS